MDNTNLESTPAQPARKTRKRKMTKAQRKAISDAATARWAARKAGAPVAPVKEAAPQIAPPSPAVLKLQEQVVGLVSLRSSARQRLTDAHALYLQAQSAFQAAEADVKGTEQDAQYLLGLIAQLENRTPAVTQAAPVLQMPQTMAGVSSEPSRPAATYAVGSADDLRREMRGMM